MKKDSIRLVTEYSSTNKTNLINLINELSDYDKEEIKDWIKEIRKVPIDYNINIEEYMSEQHRKMKID